MKNLETLKLERLIKINLGLGMGKETAKEFAKNQIERENLDSIQKFRREPKNEHFTNYDGIQKR